MSEYSKALLSTLAMERSAMLNDGLIPVAVRLTPEEVLTLRDSITLVPTTTDTVMRIFGLEILEQPGPHALAERFVVRP